MANRSELDCPVCLEKFEEQGNHEPRILSCGHTLCLRCIDNILRTNESCCPFCRKPQQCRDVDHLPRNFAVLQFLTTSGKQTVLNNLRELNMQELDEVMLGMQRRRVELQIQKLQDDRELEITVRHQARTEHASAVAELELAIKTVSQKEDIVQAWSMELQSVDKRIGVLDAKILELENSTIVAGGSMTSEASSSLHTLATESKPSNGSISSSSGRPSSSRKRKITSGSHPPSTGVRLLPPFPWSCIDEDI
jgi:hypothetical protein